MHEQPSDSLPDRRELQGSSTVNPSPKMPVNTSVSLSTLLRNEFNHTAGLGNLLLGKLRDVAGSDNEGNLGDAALAKDLGVAERKEVEDWCRVLFLAGEVGFAGFQGDERP